MLSIYRLQDLEKSGSSQPAHRAEERFSDIIPEGERLTKEHIGGFRTD